MPVRWTEDLATGIAEIDARHQELYRQVAALHEAMRTNRLDLVGGVLEYLQHYTAGHFPTEERLMAVCRYPGRQEHALLHRSFVEELNRRRNEFDRLGVQPSLVVELADWLGLWLADHVRRADGILGRFYRSTMAPPGSGSADQGNR